MGLGPLLTCFAGALLCPPAAPIVPSRSQLSSLFIYIFVQNKEKPNRFLPILLDWSLFLGKGASPLTVSQHTGTGTSLLTIQSPYSVLLPA